MHLALALFTLIILPDPYNPVMRDIGQMRLREVKGGLSHARDGVRPESIDNSVMVMMMMTVINMHRVLYNPELPHAFSR